MSNDYDIVPPVNVPTYNGPDRRYYQEFFVGIDNRSERYILQNRYNITKQDKTGLVINLII